MKTYNILGIDKFKSNIGNKSRLLGIDPGAKNVGIAICDENLMVATPLKTILKNKFDFLSNEIDKIIKDNDIITHSYDTIKTQNIKLSPNNQKKGKYVDFIERYAFVNV